MKRSAVFFVFVAAACGGVAGSSDGNTGVPAVDAGGVSPTACAPILALGAACHDPTPEPSCACGNGVLDAPGQDCDREECDGTAFGGKTCASLGFRAGALACDVSCGLDTRGCDACVRGRGIAACTSAVTSAIHASRLALDANDGTVALAWSDRRGGHFATLGRDLVLRSESACVGDGGRGGVAVASTPSGWVAAFATDTGIDIFSLDACGQPRGKPRQILGGSPFLASRRKSGAPVGGPLFVFTVGGSRVAVLLREDGTEETLPVSVPDLPVDEENATAVFVGDAFLYAERRYTAPSGSDSTVDVVRIGLDGKMASQTKPVETQTELPVLATAGDMIVLTYQAYGTVDPAARSRWVRLDANGRALGAPAPLPLSSGWQIPLLAVGGSLRAVVRDDQSFRAVALDGAASDIALVQGQTTPIEAKSVPDGQDAVFAWLGQSGEIGAARAQP